MALPTELALSIETITGKLVNPSNPDPTSIDVHDIAWALSRIPRFAGHSITEIPYNVAQHCIYVSELLERAIYSTVDETDELFPIVSDEKVVTELVAARDTDAKTCFSLMLKALLHDAHEAYIGDVPSPVKRIPSLTKTFKDLEDKLDTAIFSHFGLDVPTLTDKSIIKYFDKLAQAIEGYQFMPSRGLHWNLPKPPLTLIQEFPEPQRPIDSYKAFLKRFEYLHGQ